MADGKQFGCERRRDYAAVLHLLARFDDDLRIPPGRFCPCRTVRSGEGIYRSRAAAPLALLRVSSGVGVDPIDALQPYVQVAYLRWIDGERAGLAAVGHSVRILLVTRGTPAAALMQRAADFWSIGHPDGFELLQRVAAPAGSSLRLGPVRRTTRSH
jgi:hypothetical protein